MKIIITERQHKYLKEETTSINIQGIDNVINVILEKNPELDEDKYIDFIKNVITNSNISNMVVEPLQQGIAGFTLPDKIILNSKIFDYPNLPGGLFVLFHELGHALQFKKYGADKMYELYLGETTVEEAAEKMVEYEKVADRFALTKIKEMNKMGLYVGWIAGLDFYAGGYENKINDYIRFIEKMKTALEEENITNPQQASIFMYNYVKNSTNIFGW